MKALIALLLSAALVFASSNAVSAHSLQWRSDFLHNTGGGLKNGSEHIGQLDVAIELASSGLFDRNAKWLVSAFYNNGGSFTSRVGDIQVVSNIEADTEGVRLNEAWVDQPLPWGDSSILIGKYDLNGEFDVLDSALPFVNSAFGIGTDIGQTGINGPSIFPATGLALRLQIGLSDNWSAKIAVMDGVPGEPDEPGKTQVRLNSEEGALVVIEAAFNDDSRRLLGGYWRYTKAPDPICDISLCGELKGANSGLYIRGESALMTKSASRRIDGFFRIGMASREFNAFARFYSLGVLVNAPFVARGEDSLGLALAYGDTGSVFESALGASGIEPANREGVVELTYVAALRPNLKLQPTIQFIDNPGASSLVTDAWALGLRIDFSFR